LWNLAYAVNHSGNNKFVDIIWYDASSDSEFYVVDNYVLSPTQFIKFDGGAYIVLEEGDQVRATSETGSSMNVLCTFEVYRNKG
jgi:dTDP-4-dehydrorhamnose reductase